MKKLLILLITVMSSVCLLINVVVALYLPDYVPDSGYYYLSKDYAYSLFRWHEHGFNKTYEEAYEHEFRVSSRGFASVTGYWSSNLPQAYLDVEDDYWGPYVIDEFVVGCDNAEATIAGYTYFMYIDLEDQDSNVSSSSTILEAELCWDFPLFGSNNYPMEWYTISSFTAPSYGSWNSEQPMSIQTQRNQTKIQTNEPSGDIKGAVLSFNKYVSSEEADSFLGELRVKPTRAWFKSRRYEFEGGFYVNNFIEETLYVISENLKQDLSKTIQKLGSTKCRVEQDILKMIKNQIERNIKALREVNLYGLEVEGEYSELSKLGKDPFLANIQYFDLSGRGKLKPVKPDPKP